MHGHMSGDVYGADAQLAVTLVNSEDRAAGTDRLGDLNGLRALLAPWPRWQQRVTWSDLDGLRRARPRLREVFERSATDATGAVTTLNALLRASTARPRLQTGTEPPRLVLVGDAPSIASAVFSSAVLGVAMDIDAVGLSRLGVCDALGCRHVYVDRSAQGLRRFCSERCGVRTNVAAHRARKRAAIAPASAD